MVLSDGNVVSVDAELRVGGSSGLTAKVAKVNTLTVGGLPLEVVRATIDDAGTVKFDIDRKTVTAAAFHVDNNVEAKLPPSTRASSNAQSLEFRIVDGKFDPVHTRQDRDRREGQAVERNGGFRERQSRPVLYGPESTLGRCQHQFVSPVDSSGAM